MTLAGPAAAGGPLERAEAAATVACRWLAAAGVLGMIAVAGLTVADALMRFVFAAPIRALNEMVAMIFSVAVAACLPYALIAGGQLTVDILESRMSPRVAALLEAVGALTVLALFCAIAWCVGGYAAELTAGRRVTIILGWRTGPWTYAVAGLFACAAVVQMLMTMRACGSAWRSFGAAGGARPVDGVALALSGAVVLVIAGLVLWASLDFAHAKKVVTGSPTASTFAAFALMWALLLAKFPMGGVMGLIGVTGSMLFLDPKPALSALGSNVAGFLTSSEVAVLPLFLLMGSFAAVAGIADDIYRLAHALLSGFRGGLALATIGGCAGFGAVTGSSVATVATIGKVAIPQMSQRGYSNELTMGCVAAGGTLGQLVPPSTAIIVYALLTEQSIGKLFVALVVPAVITVLSYFATIWVIVRLRPGTAPPTSRSTTAEVLTALRGALAVFVLFGLVLGGLYAGIFTATESASVGVIGAFLLALARGKLRRATFWQVMSEATSTVGMIYLLIIGAVTFSFYVGVTGLPEKVAGWVTGLQMDKLTLVAIILLIYLVLGCVMDSFGLMIITTPIIAPLITQMGYDLIWWGIVMVVVVETGMITPPFGLNMFVLKSIASAPLMAIYRGCIPFVIADFAKLALLVLVPATVLWLPSTMFK